MLTLSNGVKKPQDGDSGAIFFDALESNAQIQNDHTHDGEDSELLPSTSISVTSQTIPQVGVPVATAWSEVADDSWRSTVTLPTGVTFSDFGMEFVVTASGDAADVGQRIHPTVTKIDEDSYYVFVSKDGMTLKAIYR